MLKKKLCKIENCGYPVWSGGLCKNHSARVPMKKVRKESYSKKAIDKATKIGMMRVFFLEIWNERPHKSEVSGTYLGKEPLTIYFHHILPKESHVVAEFDPENIILLTGDEHANVESDKYKYEEINKRRDKLLKKYNLI